MIQLREDRFRQQRDMSTASRPLQGKMALFPAPAHRRPPPQATHRSASVPPPTKSTGAPCFPCIYSSKSSCWCSSPACAVVVMRTLNIDKCCMWWKLPPPFPSPSWVLWMRRQPRCRWRSFPYSRNPQQLISTPKGRNRDKKNVIVTKEWYERSSFMRGGSTLYGAWYSELFLLKALGAVRSQEKELVQLYSSLFDRYDTRPPAYCPFLAWFPYNCLGGVQPLHYRGTMRRKHART